MDPPPPDPVALPADDEAQSVIDPDHPIFSRVQEAFKEQLLRQIDQVELSYREKAEEFARKEKEHTDIGVELYRVQQDLAKMHSHLENLHDKYNAAVQARGSMEQELQRINTNLELQKQLHDAQLKKVRDAQIELDRVNETVHDVQQYHEQMQGEITLIRRAAYVADRDLVIKEGGKQGQDFLIDNYQAQIKRLQEQHGLYEAQLIAQQEETKAARATLSEAATEKEAILVEEKSLLSQYKSSVTGMQRRDEALQQTEIALRSQEDNLQAMQNELIGFKISIRQEEERAEKQTELLSKVEHESQELKAAIARYHDQRDQLTKEFTDLKRMADAQTDVAAKARHEQRLLEQKLEHLQMAIQQTRAEQVAVEGRIRAHMDERCSFSRSVSATAQGAERIRQEIHEKELQASSLQNELQRVRLDILNTQAHTSSLQKALDTLLAQLKEKDSIIERYEQEIRRKNDLITKKQSEVDKLNRKYAQLTENMKDENVGPLEACVNNLWKEIETKKSECEALERNWMRLQINLVAMMKQAQDEEEGIAQTKAKQTVLSQRGIRLDASCKAELSEIHELQAGIAKMHTDMQRLNAEIAKNSVKQQELASSNFNMEADFVARLKALELDALRLESQIVENKQGKEAMKTDTVEAERQMMLWERKIELERETQEALDPTKSQSDVAEMEREIHRMQLRYKSLELEQEQLLRTMEMAIKKRVAIAEAASATPKSKGVPTQAGLRQANSDIQRKLKAAADEAARYDQELESASQQQAQLERQVEATSDECKRFREEEKNMQELATGLLMEKQKNLDRITRAQRFVKRYQNEAAGTFAPTCPEAELEQRLTAQTARKEHLDAIILALRSQFPFIKLVG